MALKLDKAGKLRLSEKDVVRQCCDWMQINGFHLHRTGYGEIYKDDRLVDTVGVVGMPDWQFIRYGLYGYSTLVWIEFKRPACKGYRGGKLSDEQRDWIEQERLRGAEVWVIDSLESLQKMYLERIGK
jgi:hypothetical protein